MGIQFSSLQLKDQNTSGYKTKTMLTSNNAKNIYERILLPIRYPFSVVEVWCRKMEDEN
jgi:hypothetical protein